MNTVVCRAVLLGAAILSMALITIFVSGNKATSQTATRARSEMPRQQELRQFRAASENYVPETRAGNQTPLGAAAPQFARFIAEMHPSIHREFADQYIVRLNENPPGDALNDESLSTTLEIAIAANGNLARIGIVRSSGDVLFDLGVFRAMTRAQPFPSSPDVIRSRDGLVWLRWQFDRGPRLCGAVNVQPFLLGRMRRSAVGAAQSGGK